MLWAEVVGPFVSEHPELGLPGGEEGYELYRWATSAVASYSFILGDDKYQVRRSRRTAPPAVLPSCSRLV